MTKTNCHILISRDEYNKLVESFPQWMGYSWPKFGKDWNVGGVRVYNAPNKEHIKNLLKHIKLIRA